MKVTDLFEAPEPETVWDLSELEGKKMSREKAVKFLAKLPYLETNSPNKSVFTVKKGVKFNMAKLVKLLNAMDPSINAYKWPNSTRKFHVEFNYDHPVDGKILFVPPTHKEFMEMSKEQREEEGKKFSELVSDLYDKERSTMRNDPGSSGWFMTHNVSDWFTTIVGQFTDGPFKGRYFKVGKPYGSDYKVGGVIKVTADPEYGRVKVKK